MKTYTIVIAAGLLASVMVATSAAQIGGGSLTNPVSAGGSFTSPPGSAGYSPTTPLSTYRNSLVPNKRGVYEYSRTPALGSARTYLGAVPYGSTLDANRMSQADSFMRRSGLPSYVQDTNPSLAEFYNTSSLAVAPARRSASSDLMAAELNYRSGRSTYAQKPTMTDTLGIYQPRSTLSMSPEELDRLSGRSALHPGSDLGVDALLANTVTANNRQDFYKTALKTEESKRLERLIDDTLLPARPTEPDVALTTETRQLQEVLEQGRKQREEMAARLAKPITIDQTPEPQDLQSTEDAQADTEATRTAASDKASILPNPLEIPVADSVKARRILGEHKDFDSLAREKFEGFMDEGTSLLKEGKFYKAIHAFVLAAVWNNDSAQANLHRGMAHFAAGEYMSGSLFVRRAMVLSPEYTASGIDINQLIGDRDVIENRIIEAVDWQEKGNSGELAFLLAYVYYQDQKHSQARKYAEIAEQRLPEDEAVALLKKAVGGGL